MTVFVKKIGGSVAVVIPNSVARDMALTEGTPLDISASLAGIVLRKQGLRPRRPLGGIVARITPGSYRRRSHEMSRDSAVGKEIG
jgi:antitoxin component of MazEF toxin-antitoxin module